MVRRSCCCRNKVSPTCRLYAKLRNMSFGREIEIVVDVKTNVEIKGEKKNEKFIKGITINSYHDGGNCIYSRLYK